MHQHEKSKDGLISYQFRTFKYAIRGIRFFFKGETKATVHLISATCAIILGVYFKINRFEWLFVALAIGLVISLEIVNSVIESIANLINPNHDTRIGKVKDMSAAAVLIAALTALTIGLLIFIPKLVLVIS